MMSEQRQGSERFNGELKQGAETGQQKNFQI